MDTRHDSWQNELFACNIREMAEVDTNHVASSYNDGFHFTGFVLQTNCLLGALWSMDSSPMLQQKYFIQNAAL
jgi:hypothetical protein